MYALTILQGLVLFKIMSCQYHNLNLPDEHIAFYLNSHPEIAENCRINPSCQNKMHLDRNACWGYEDNCTADHRYSIPHCPEGSRGWTQTKEEQMEEFFKAGDFGYIRERRKEFQVYCKPQSIDDSLLACIKYTRYCITRNILIDFKNLINIPEPMRYREDVIGPGQIGGHCKLDTLGLKKEGGHKSPLQSWFAELEPFIELSEEPITNGLCDIIIDKPTFLMKLDATVSMYHHFCDFFNLYASQHLNGSFSRDIQIVVWDTLPYSSNYAIIWKVFTQHPVMNLDSFKGKKVCFKNAILPFLPRMIYGMYYNMPLIPGCENSGLFHAFNRHILHRLNIKRNHTTGGKLRILLLSRGTQYRNILNENDIFRALSAVPDYEVKRIDFNRKIKFREQIKMTQNTDIFIGMHGSGLTHVLFLPDWAVLFEIYNCGDENCYKDLARLRGVTYMTWENEDKVISQDEGHHPTLGAHAKFTNYEFDVDECLRLVGQAAVNVREHKAWKNAHQEYHNLIHNEL